MDGASIAKRVGEISAWHAITVDEVVPVRRLQARGLDNGAAIEQGSIFRWMLPTRSRPS